MRSIALFGGTFDPIHNGHIETSCRIQATFHFDTYYFLPCKIPALKAAAHASSQQRIDMLQLAIPESQHFAVDAREIYRSTPSYTVDTLESFREENEEASISLILGYDAFLSLPQWHEWEKIITLANILVINRNEFAKLPIPEDLEELLKTHQSLRKSKLLTTRSGVIVRFDAGHYEESSTGIREELSANHNVNHLIPQPVLDYITEQGLYLSK